MPQVFTSLTRKTISSGISTFIRHTNATMGVRHLSLNHRLLAKPKEPVQEKVNDGPIRFSTSKASHRTWNVERSLGSQYQRPWWKVLPVSVVGVGFLLWCAFREETDIDAQLEKELYQHLPGLRPDEANEEK
ncbi:ubiquinol-cytochrome c reductase complex assembly factor 4 [Stigmatopora nigra]